MRGCSALVHKVCGAGGAPRKSIALESGLILLLEWGVKYLTRDGATIKRTLTMLVDRPHLVTPHGLAARVHHKKVAGAHVELTTMLETRSFLVSLLSITIQVLTKDGMLVMLRVTSAGRGEMLNEGRSSIVGMLVVDSATIL